MSTRIKPADYTTLAEDYAKYRPDYSADVLDTLLAIVDAPRAGFRMADVGAGTGKWTRMVAERGILCEAVEPNDAMREQGIRWTQGLPVTWRKGTGESTGLKTGGVAWLTMASSFHWTDASRSLPEFHRVLQPGGFLTVLYNPRDIERSPLHQEIEAMIYAMAPHIERRSSGSARHVRDYTHELVAAKHFERVVFVEAEHDIAMSRERYLGAWRSVNDIQEQAGPELFQRMLDAIAERIADLDEIVVPYKTRAWTARRVD